MFDQNGNLLTNGQIDLETGQVRFTIGTPYSGPLLINVSDTNGTEGDYLDEATNVSTSLGEPLRAMVMADTASDIQLTVSPLTELAVRQAGVDQTDPSLTADDVAMNDEIGALFGVEDITGDVVTVLDGDYDAGEGLNAAEKSGGVDVKADGATTGDDVTISWGTQTYTHTVGER